MSSKEDTLFFSDRASSDSNLQLLKWSTHTSRWEGDQEKYLKALSFEANCPPRNEIIDLDFKSGDRTTLAIKLQSRWYRAGFLVYQAIIILLKIFLFLDYSKDWGKNTLSLVYSNTGLLHKIDFKKMCWRLQNSRRRQEHGIFSMGSFSSSSFASEYLNIYHLSAFLQLVCPSISFPHSNKRLEKAYFVFLQFWDFREGVLCNEVDCSS